MRPWLRQRPPEQPFVLDTAKTLEGDVPLVVDPSKTMQALIALLDLLDQPERTCACGTKMELVASDLYRSTGGQAWQCPSCLTTWGRFSAVHVELYALKCAREAGRIE